MSPSSGSSALKPGHSRGCEHRRADAGMSVVAERCRFRWSAGSGESRPKRSCAGLLSNHKRPDPPSALADVISGCQFTVLASVHQGLQLTRCAYGGERPRYH